MLSFPLTCLCSLDLSPSVPSSMTREKRVQTGQTGQAVSTVGANSDIRNRYCTDSGAVVCCGKEGVAQTGARSCLVGAALLAQRVLRRYCNATALS
ncbi:unnamed protein product [Caenorhabditis auriculariae]|uniref:Uncharacterized protein n=1 Tax=Caenorhabditis auriculariae TaxID=2777116 RepID=A0A8S1HQH4_9PELO|nr:unnamed protein product [Caenorhabditis auriculariae]